MTATLMAFHVSCALQEMRIRQALLRAPVAPASSRPPSVPVHRYVSQGRQAEACIDCGQPAHQRRIRCVSCLAANAEGQRVRARARRARVRREMAEYLASRPAKPVSAPPPLPVNVDDKGISAEMRALMAKRQ